MPIIVKCPSCGKTLAAPDGGAGKRAKCPGCAQVMTIPAAVAAQPPAAVPIPQAASPHPAGAPPAVAESYSFGEPQAAASPVAVAGEQRRPCPECGEMIVAGAAKCRFCGAIFDPKLRANVSSNSSGIETLIPYKNAQALWAYYLGVFSLIPCLGIPLGIAALILGVRGVKYSGLHPEAKGKAHAWAGIILGGICSAGYVSLIVWVVLSINQTHR